MPASHHALDETTRTRLEAVMARFPGVSVLVVGDLILDWYTVGRPTRISREAPIAVLEYSHDYSVPGGGTSPACTVASLGGQSYLAGVVGEDAWASELRSVLARYGVDTGGMVLDRSRPTSCKKRIVAQVTSTLYQQVARIDHVDRTPIGPEVEGALVRAIEQCLPACDAVLLSNYRSGTLTPAVIERTRTLARDLGKISTVDSQGDLELFHGFGIVKCNQPEAEEALRRPLTGDDEFEAGLSELVERLDAQAVIVTRSAEGMSVMTRSGQYCHIPVTNSSEVFDVTGAGDTVIALVTLAAAAGADLFDAARLANYGAGVVVRKWGNAVLRPDELREALNE
ncbi:MAG TPA: PfkB family carbohydrate kinase [Chloroflexia bacterium]|nr:PfkB family carbohydrate kinase [Chloroflexia bacterium]